MQPKILLVDDREDNLLSIEAIFEPDGYRFVKANSGRSALKILLTEFDFALILMDVKMPNLNGFETASLIYEREKLKHIPIIFITANNFGDENAYKGYQAGAVDYIYKPINPNVLRAKVSVLIDLYRKNQQLILQEQKLVAINRSLENEIKERKASEEKVKMLNHRLLENISNLESANRDLDRFAFMASHDLQEPLRKIRVFSDRLFHKYQQLLDDDGKSNLNRIQQAAERMQALITDILTFSKVSAEKMTFSECNLKEVINDILADVDEEVRQRHAQIEVDDMYTIQGNPGLIRPLFYNLINNALKYSKKDITPIIKIRSELSMTTSTRNGGTVDNRYCRIYIEDNGIGFDQKYAEEIFGMFKRLHRHAEFEGTGIGLALCKKIVEQHNGYISARSKINEGSTFIISLPLMHQKEHAFK
ncbi:response regulator [Pseudochryseolinea flava]|uniref:histidine kinase n=1 Tax=Pseudochryseolinea flava TaxID=2059302 RepID=A0A364XWL1_9BACT|nr:response regulator [Pseudochryseolinea flava]RAV98759.1 hybrid sensor histidine kinase/response regulator [Pseudochryseolinea flava]